MVQILRFFLLGTYLGVLPLCLAAGPLRLAAAQTTIEHAPLALALRDFYNGTFSIVNGGVSNIVGTSASARAVDLAANAETQALRQFARNRSLRLLLVVVESTYRLIVRNGSGTIHSVADLKGKRIATSDLSSAGYFVEKLLREKGGLERGAYTLVTNAGMCLRAPCGANTYPGMLASGAVDAVGMWEPLGELSLRAAGGRNKVAVFADKAVYREVYSLFTTQAKLDDPERRASIVTFVRALLRMQAAFDREPDKAIKRVESLVNIDEGVLKAVWEDHSWKGGLPDDLVDFMMEEDKYVARLENRAAMKKEEIAKMVDPSVLREAMEAEGLH